MQVHKRRFERFKLLSADADPDSNAWELVRAIQAASNVQNAEPQEPSKRGLKRVSGFILRKYETMLT